MAEPKELYPHGTPDNQAVPFDIERPLGLILRSFTGAPTALDALPPGEDYVLALFASVACVVSFGAVVPSLVEGTFLSNCVFVPASVILSVSPDPSAGKSFSVMAADGISSGDLSIQVIQRWAGLNVPVSSRRG